MFKEEGLREEGASQFSQQLQEDKKVLGKKERHGRPQAISQSTQKPSRYHLPICNKPRPHNLARSISGGIQNVGKW